jgi:hypothetical protein
MLLTVSCSPARARDARYSYFKQNCSSFCSLAVSLVKLCRCTAAMGAVGPEARHVEGIVVSVHGIKSRLEALVDAAAACVYCREGMVKVMGPAAARWRLQVHCLSLTRSGCAAR